MKKYLKKILFILVFLMIFNMNTMIANAETYSYGYAVGKNEDCINQQWTPENYSCVVGSNPKTKFEGEWEGNKLVLNYGDGTFKNPNEQKSNLVSTWIYNYEEINNYYNLTKTAPPVIMTCLTTINSDHSSTNIYTYYPGDFSKPSTGFLSGTYCFYYAESQYANLNTCIGFDSFIENLKQIKTQSGCDSQEFKTAKERLVNYCKTYVERSGYETTDENGISALRDCQVKCTDVYTYIDDVCSINDATKYETNSCGLTKSLVGWFLRLLKIVRYIVPAIAIVLTILDYVTAILSSNDDAFKKAGGKFGKRLIIIVILFLLPVLLQFFFDVFNIPGLDSKNPFCMKK